MKFRIALILCLATALALGCKKDQATEVDSAEKSAELAPEVEPEEPAPEPKLFGEAWAQADEAQKTAAFEEPAKLRGLMSYEVVRSATPEPDADEVGPYSLALKNEKTKDMNRAQDIEIRRLRAVFVRQARIFEGQDLATLCKAECQRSAVNAAFAKVAGGPIFGDDGKPNAEALKKLFAGLYIQPDSKLLGLEAKEVYGLVRPAARDISGLYAGLDAIGLETVSEAFETAVKEHPEPETGVNREMLKFYKRYTNLEGVAQKAGVESEASHWTTVGFWMRRIHDDTAPVLVSFMNKVLKDYDPEWHSKHFAASGD